MMVYITRTIHHLIKVILNNVLSQVFCIILIIDGSVSSNHSINMTIINTIMFGSMFQVGLLIASFKVSTFPNKPIFYTHLSETFIHVTTYAVVKLKLCLCKRANVKLPYI